MGDRAGAARPARAGRRPLTAPPHRSCGAARSSRSATWVGSADSEYVDGVAKLDRRLPILLNPDGLLAGITLAV